ncbi:MAG: hypothetical protein ABGX05_08790, partial [Pirellulaceae bacterium]
MTIELPINDVALPRDVAEFIEEAESRVNEFVRQHAVRPTGFVASDSTTVYRALRTITETNLSTGTICCEWGSGLGVMASLASMLGFQACGIEIEKSLVEVSRQLAAD